MLDAPFGRFTVCTTHLSFVPGVNLRPLATAFTFPADGPRRHLDHVLGGDGVRTAGPAEAVRLEVSDHRALVVACDLV